MDDTLPDTSSPRSWRSFARFGLRGLLICTFICAVVMAYFSARINRTRHESRIKAELEANDITVARASGLRESADERFDRSVGPTYGQLCIDEWLDIPLYDPVVAIFAEEGFAYHNDRMNDLLSRLSELPQVQLVSFETALVQDQHLVHLRELPRLRTLYLRRARITDAGLRHIAHLQELRRLGLDKTPISDEGIESVGRLKNLELLCLANTKVTDACIVDLLQLTHLKQLDLSYTQFTPDGVKALHKAMPGTDILFHER